MSYVIEIHLYVRDAGPQVGTEAHSRYLDQAHWNAVEAAQEIIRADERLDLMRTGHGVRQGPQ